MNVPQIRLLSLISLFVTAVCVSLVGATVWGALAAIDRQHKSDAIVKAADSTITMAGNAESAQRGWLLTGTDAFLYPRYQDSVAAMCSSTETLVALIHDEGDETQIGRVTKVESLVNRKKAELAYTLDQTKEGRKLYAVAHVREGDGRRIMDTLDMEISAIKSVEYAKMKKDGGISRGRAIVAIWVAVFGGLVQLFSLAIIVALAHSPEPVVTVVKLIPAEPGASELCPQK